MKEVLFVIGFILLAMYGFNHDFNKAKAEHKAKIELREIDNITHIKYFTELK